MVEPPQHHAARCLPPRFSSHGGLFVDKENLAGKGLETELTQTLLGFPSEFPFEFASSGFSPALSSPGDSTETEESSDDEEDFLAGLTRRLALSTQRVSVPSFSDQKTDGKNRVSAFSPQSTLNGFGSMSASSKGSPNGPSPQILSPPATPFCPKDDTWDVIYAAAGQVARMNMNSANRLSHPNSSSSCYRPSSIPDYAPPMQKSANADAGVFRQYVHTNQNLLKQEEALKQQCFSIWGSQTKGSYDIFERKYQYPNQVDDHKRFYGVDGYDDGCHMRPLGRHVSAFPPTPQRQLHRGPSSSSAMKGGFPAGSGAKKECSGTGVFLPRRYTNPADSHNKTGYSNVILPAQPMNLNFDYDKPQQRTASGFFASNYDSVIAKRNVLAQRGVRLTGGPRNQKMPLSTEWMY